MARQARRGQGSLRGQAVCSSCRYRRVLTEHRGDLPPAIDLSQLDLPTGHEAEEQDQRGLFARQRALRLHAAPEFFVESLNHIRCAQRFPLGLGETEEREKLVAAFPQARYHAWTALGPRPLEGREGGSGRVATGRV